MRIIVVESRMMFSKTRPRLWAVHAAHPMPTISASAKSVMPELTGRPNVLTNSVSICAPIQTV